MIALLWALSLMVTYTVASGRPEAAAAASTLSFSLCGSVDLGPDGAKFDISAATEARLRKIKQKLRTYINQLAQSLSPAEAAAARLALRKLNNAIGALPADIKLTAGVDGRLMINGSLADPIIEAALRGQGTAELDDIFGRAMATSKMKVLSNEVIAQMYTDAGVSLAGVDLVCVSADGTAVFKASTPVGSTPDPYFAANMGAQLKLISRDSTGYRVYLPRGAEGRVSIARASPCN